MTAINRTLIELHGLVFVTVRSNAVCLLAIGLLLFVPDVAFASGGPDLPWNTPLTNILNNLQGPTTSVIMTLAIVGSALVLMFTGIGLLARAFLTVIIAAAAAIQAPTLLSTIGLTAASVL